MSAGAGAAWTDDPTVLADHFLWRRIPGWHFVWDGNRNTIRPSSAAFDNDPDGSPMSVQLAEVLLEYGLDERHVLSGHRGFAIARLRAESARTCDQGIARDPKPDEPAHALVFGEKPDRIRKRLGRASEWQSEPAALYLGDGFLLFEDPTGRPCVRRPNGQQEAVVPGPPPVPEWLRAAQTWLAEPGSAGSALNPAGAAAVESWLLPAV
jgi:hypothetical protein